MKAQNIAELKVILQMMHAWENLPDETIRNRLKAFYRATLCVARS